MGKTNETITARLNSRSAASNATLPSNRIFSEAQQQYRFYLNLDGVPVAYISDVSRPGYKLETEKFQLLNYVFNFPKGRVEWNPIQFTVKEVFSRDLTNSVASLFIRKLTDFAYDYPNNINPNSLKDVSKLALINSLGAVTIQSLDPDGNVVETWRIHNAFIHEANFSDYKYSAEDLTNVTVKITYDWAEIKYHSAPG